MRALPSPVDDIDAAPVLRPKTLGRHPARETPLPQMKLQSPNREDGRREAAEFIDNVLRRLGVSNDELAIALGVNRKLFDNWRTAKDGVQLGDLIAFAKNGGGRQAVEVAEALVRRLRRMSSAHDD